MLPHCRDSSFTSLLYSPVQNTPPEGELHNKLHWINKNTSRERFHLPIPSSVINLSQAICSLLYHHGQDKSVQYTHTGTCIHSHIYTCVHKSLQCSLDTAIFTFTWLYRDKQCSPFTANGGNEQQGRGSSLFQSCRKWLTQLIPIVKPQPWKEFSCSNILLHHNDKPALLYSTWTCFQAWA